LCFPWLGGLGFFCMLEVLCVVFVYLEALDAFFLVYNTLTYQKKKKRRWETLTRAGSLESTEKLEISPLEVKAPSILLNASIA
jgi:hypothetical protein